MKNVSTARALLIVCAVAATVGTSACSSADVAGTDLKPVSLSFTASASSASLGSATEAALPPVLGAAPTITKVQIVLTKLALARSDDVNCVSESFNESTDETSGDCQQVTRQPLLVNMPVDGTLRTHVNVPLGGGTYRKLEARLAAATMTTAAGAAFLDANPDFANSSLRIDGVFNGVPFTFKMALQANIDMKFSPALVIDARSKNATIAVDVSRWFVTVNGDVIDPFRATSGTPAAAIIENNIRASFRVFADN
jgi:hypothetical protein